MDIEKDDVFQTEDVFRLQAGALKLEEEIEGLLNEGTVTAYDRIAEICFDESNQKYVKRSRKLMTARIFSEAENSNRKHNTGRTAFVTDNFEDLESIYQELVFRLRRIEFGKDINIENDIWGFLKQMGLNVEFLVAVLGATKYLYQKDKIIDRIMGTAND